MEPWPVNMMTSVAGALAWMAFSTSRPFIAGQAQVEQDDFGF